MGRKLGSLATGTIIQIPEPWVPISVTQYTKDATVMTPVVPIAEYPNYYHYLALDKRDVAQNNFATRGWYLIVVRSLDGGKTFDDLEAFYQISEKQPEFPVNWSEEVKETDEYVKRHMCEIMPETCAPKEISIWPWIALGAGAGVVALLIISRRSRRR